MTVRDICNAFLNQKQLLVDSGELSPRTWREYKVVCDMLVKRMGKRRVVTDIRPDDFSDLRAWMAGQWGLYRLANTIQYTRSVFKHAFDSDMFDRPVRFGPGFSRPSQKTLRVERARRGPKLFTADEIRRLIDAAGTPLKAMLLLAINCGYGNNDCGTLPLSAVDLDRGWIDYARPKTGMPRRCPLWPRTVQAMRDALAVRPQTNDEADAGLFFVTTHGLAWARDTTTHNPVTKETARLLKALRHHRPQGLGFYTLRHVFRTVADGAKGPISGRFYYGTRSSPYVLCVPRGHR